MKRCIACLVLAGIIGSSLMGCSAAANGPTTPSVPTPPSDAGTSAQSSSGASASGAPSQSANPVTGAVSRAAQQGAGVATLAKSKEIKIGMKFAAVAKVMGSQGKKIGEATVGNVHAAQYGWYGSDPTAVLIVQFANGTVSAKSQFGLK